MAAPFPSLLAPTDEHTKENQSLDRHPDRYSRVFSKHPSLSHLLLLFSPHTQKTIHLLFCHLQKHNKLLLPKKFPVSNNRRANLPHPRWPPAAPPPPPTCAAHQVRNRRKDWLPGTSRRCPNTVWETSTPTGKGRRAREAQHAHTYDSHETHSRTRDSHTRLNARFFAHPSIVHFTHTTATFLLHDLNEHNTRMGFADQHLPPPGDRPDAHVYKDEDGYYVVKEEYRKPTNPFERAKLAGVFWCSIYTFSSVMHFPHHHVCAITIHASLPARPVLENFVSLSLTVSSFHPTCR